MAQRSYLGNVQTLSRTPVMLNAEVTIGATGAPTLVSAQSPGITSISRSATGRYVLTLDSTYNRLIGLTLTTTKSDSASGIGGREVRAQTLTTTKTITFSTLDYAGAEADPASGTTLSIVLDLRNSEK